MPSHVSGRCTNILSVFFDSLTIRPARWVPFFFVRAHTFPPFSIPFGPLPAPFHIAPKSAFFQQIGWNPPSQPSSAFFKSFLFLSLLKRRIEFFLRGFFLFFFLFFLLHFGVPECAAPTFRVYRAAFSRHFAANPPRHAHLFLLAALAFYDTVFSEVLSFLLPLHREIS